MELYGALFFGAVDKLEDLPTRLPEGTQRVVLDLHRLVAMDTSGLEALHQLRQALQRRGITMDLARAAEAPLSLLERSGFAEELGPQHLWPTLEAALAPARP
jgi:SulP family sulfate permease